MESDPSKIKVTVKVLRSQGSRNLWRWPRSLPEPQACNLQIEDDGQKVHYELTSNDHDPAVEIVLKDATAPIFRYELPLEIAQDKRFAPSKDLGYSLRGQLFLITPVSQRPPPITQWRVEVDPSVLGPHDSFATTSGTRLIQDFVTGRGGSFNFFALVGPLLHAEFKDPRPRVDHFAAASSVLFDTRWLAAEIAGMRDNMDLYFGDVRQPEFGTLMVSSYHEPWEPRLKITPASRGMLLDIHHHQLWEYQQRLQVGQYLARDKVWVIRPQPAESYGKGQPAGWVNGLSRYIAQHIAFKNGLLSLEELALDLNRMQQEEFVSEQERNAFQKHESIAAASSLLWLAQLDAQLRAQADPSKSVRQWLLNLIVLRQQIGRELSLQEIAGELERLSDKKTAESWRKLMRGELFFRPTPQVHKPCLSVRTQSYRRFTLGFRPGEVGTDLGWVFGPAKKAGLQENDKFRRLEMQGSEDELTSETFAVVVVERDGKPMTFRYRPQSERHRGPVWSPVKSMYADMCSY